MPQSKEQKKKNAKVLLENRAKLTSEEQFAKLDQRLGKGVGAQKERARLAKKISSAKP